MQADINQLIKTVQISLSLSSLSSLEVRPIGVGGVAQWLGCRSVAGGLSLIYA